MLYKNSFTTLNEKSFQENSSSSLKEPITRIKCIKWDWNSIQEEQEIFKKNPTVGLPEVSKLIDSAINKRQGDWRKHSFLERKKILHKRENGFTMSTSLDGSKQPTQQFHKIFFHISNCLACNAEGLLQSKITKKEWI